MPHSSADFLFNPAIEIQSGFQLEARALVTAVASANIDLGVLPHSLWKCIDLKSAGSIVGAHLASSIAREADAIVNPIEKGHPDVLPKSAANASEASLRNYPEGLEIKGTCGNLPTGLKFPERRNRCDHLVGITWQAHHQEVERLLAIIWDFDIIHGQSPSPVITAGFYSSELSPGCWGSPSGLTGRNTKVSGMRASGKAKMVAGTLFVLNHGNYASTYARILGDLGSLEPWA